IIRARMKASTCLRWMILVPVLFVFVLMSSSAIAQSTVPAAPAVSPFVPHGTLPQRAQSLMGLSVFTLIAFGIGRLRAFRGSIPLRTILWGVILQFAFGAIVLFAPSVLETVQLAIQKLLDF